MISTFSLQVNRCSFIKDGINPFHRDGVYLDRVHAELLKDTRQPGASSIIDQVSQVTLLRVLLPWMIGQAFERLSDAQFIEILGEEVNLPVPEKVKIRNILAQQGLSAVGVKVEKGEARFMDLIGLTSAKLEVDSRGHAKLNALLDMAAQGDKNKTQQYRGKVGSGVQSAIAKQFENYNLTGKTWASLTRSKGQSDREGEKSEFENRDGSGLLRRGAQRYQVLVPSYTVMFAFFLVLNVGWVFVAERRQGTLRRLQAAPVTRGQILLGKLVPYFILSLGQGLFLLIAGRLLFGMRWGPDDWPLWRQLAALLPVVTATSLAAMGLALLVAAVARTEMQVALYGAIPVLVLALIGGCVLPPEMMPPQAQVVSLFTPQGWALQAYRELLDVDPKSVPNATVVAECCAVLSAFGLGFIGLAWGLLRVE
jgi:ABC-type multidrug transport system permease subunit